jgi:hypothetical protein
MQSILHRLFSSICSFIIFWIAITGLSSAQRFQILNGQGQLVFNAFESISKLFHSLNVCTSFITLYFVIDESDACHRWCCGSNRAFVIHVIDRMNQVSMYKIIRFFFSNIRHHSRKLFAFLVNLNVVLDVAGVLALIVVHMKHS